MAQCWEHYPGPGCQIVGVGKKAKRTRTEKKGSLRHRNADALKNAVVEEGLGSRIRRSRRENLVKKFVVNASDNASCFLPWRLQKKLVKPCL